MQACSPASHSMRHVAWFVIAQPPKHEQLLERLCTAYPLGHVVPHCVTVVPALSEQLAWLGIAQPPKHEQLLEDDVGW